MGLDGVLKYIVPSFLRMRFGGAIAAAVQNIAGMVFPADFQFRDLVPVDPRQARAAAVTRVAVATRPIANRPAGRLCHVSARKGRRQIAAALSGFTCSRRWWIVASANHRPQTRPPKFHLRHGALQAIDLAVPTDTLCRSRHGAGIGDNINRA